jgi:ribosomal protein S18 acetylase RimI-like enzyme
MSTPELTIRPYHADDEPDVIALWHRCNLVVPWNDPQRDIALKVAWQPDLLLVGTFEGNIVATVMVGYDGHRGWINYLAVAPEHQRQGFGSQIMEAAEAKLRALGCPKINLQVRATNTEVIAFYESLGFAVEDRINMGKRLP